MNITHRIRSFFRKETSTQKAINFCLHFFGLCIFFSLPEMMLSFDKGWQPGGLKIYSKPIMLVMVFYINYYGCFRLYGKRHWMLKVLSANIIIIAMVFAAEYAFIIPHDQLQDTPTDMRRGPFRHDMLMLRDFVLYMLTATLAITIRMAARMVDFERRQQQQLTQQRTEELRRLKSQLRPHFLFNALNSVYALVDVNPEMAKSAIHRLCRLLRYVLYETGSNVTLRQDLDFIDSYVRIMRLRLTDDTQLSLRLSPGNYADAIIPPLLFMSLVENTFKHGRTGGSNDSISISIVADDNGIVTCRTRNKVAPRQPDKPSGGVGLSNLRRRLELLFGPYASLSTTTIDGEFHAELTIDLNYQSSNQISIHK